jgi:ParB family transcriptional regulator, chromosome partitioning protein
VYKVNTDAIALKVEQEFTAKEKARAEKKPPVEATLAKKGRSAKKAA